MTADSDALDPDCPFCEIVAKDDPDAREVLRTADTVAFFPTEPSVLGHTMVIPRRHVPDIWSLDADLAGSLAATTVRVAEAIRLSLNPDGLNIIQSNGEAASQTVMHLHVHVVPRSTGDRIGRIWPLESNYSEQQKDAAWDMLRATLKQLSSSTPSTP